MPWKHIVVSFWRDLERPGLAHRGTALVSHHCRDTDRVPVFSICQRKRPFLWNQCVIEGIYGIYHRKPVKKFGKKELLKWQRAIRKH